MTKITEKRGELSTYAARGLLLASGLLAAVIAATILFAPEAFYAGYGIDVGSNVNLANELKAPAGLLFTAGLLMVVGAFETALAASSLALGSVIYLSYGASRLLSMTIDGVPNSALVTAAVLELAIGVTLGLTLFRWEVTD